MRQWLRRFRAYAIAFPLALAIGFGLQTYQGLTGNSGMTDPVDVPKGETAKLGPATVKLVKLVKKKPQPNSSETSSDPLPKNAVLVVAHFRGRIDDAEKAKKQKFIWCESTVENGEGWEWEADTISNDQKNVSNTCTGERLNEDFEEVKPDEGEWYRFAYSYAVPKSRAHDLRPTLGFSKEYPEYLRFEV